MYYTGSSVDNRSLDFQSISTFGRFLIIWLRKKYIFDVYESVFSIIRRIFSRKELEKKGFGTHTVSKMSLY